VQPQLIPADSQYRQIMGSEPAYYSTKRRFPRAHGPFDGYNVGPQTPVLIYDLNLGGALVHFGSEPPAAADFVLRIALPLEGLITVYAETVYRHESGVAVRFVDMDADTTRRLARTIDACFPQPRNN
jgi:hypothetical protein